MPRNLSAWIDLTIHLVVMLFLIWTIACYNIYVAIVGLLIWVFLAFFDRERCHHRSRKFERYCRSVVRNLSEMNNYAIEKLPQAIVIIDQNGRIQWNNGRLQDIMQEVPPQESDIREVWPDVQIDEAWGKEGQYDLDYGKKVLSIKYRMVHQLDNLPELMVLYVQDISEIENLRREYELSRTVMICVQIDNFTDVTQGLTEAERTSLVLAVNQYLGEWVQKLGALRRRVDEDSQIIIMNRRALNKAMSEKFDILDKVRTLIGANHLPVTLSMGVAVSNKQSTTELGKQAQDCLDLALGRGGDQVAVMLDGNTRFFGGRTKAVEKHTRVKARVVAHAIKDIMDNSDEIFIMGHWNEDYDSFGAAVGVASMARSTGKPVHIVLSKLHNGIQKMIERMYEQKEYANMLMNTSNILEPGSEVEIKGQNPVLFVVDTHVPRMVANPDLLQRIQRIVVIDHHRRSEEFIKNALMVYIEPGASSASELVAELSMYFSDNVKLSRTEATAMYAGIVLDTKNFAVQTGVRTFDAAAYLRRCGADPSSVSLMFRADYDTVMHIARAKASSELLPGGLVVAECTESVPNVQILAAQVADSLLQVEEIHMSIVCYELPDGAVGVSARSQGDYNVQVILEQFGGGGHQNAAGARIEDAELKNVRQQITVAASKYMEEVNKNEGNIGTGR